MLQPKVIFYSSLDLLYTDHSQSYCKHQHRPGLSLLRDITRFWSSSFVMIDRTGATTNPINSQILPHLMLPEFETVNDELEALCDRRARELLDHAKNTGRRLAVLYSGGIDSTLILISLLKVAKPGEIDQLVEVYLSEHSRSENPRFYTDHLLKNFKNVDSSYKFHNVVGHPNRITVTGEGCDQMFGTNVFLEFTRLYDDSIMNKSCTETRIKSLISNGSGATNGLDADVVDKIHEYYRPIINAAPVPIDTVYKYFWWLNFTLKWQSVYVRLSSYTHPRYRGTLKYEDNYTMFFGPEYFQLWAMNNSNNLIRDTWSSYKYVCKDIIRKFTHDHEWCDRKMKYGSLVSILKSKWQARIIDNQGKFYDEYSDWCFNEDNLLARLDRQAP
jgi:hypothetical protein